MLSKIIEAIEAFFAFFNKFLEKLGIIAAWDKIFGDLTKNS